MREELNPKGLLPVLAIAKNVPPKDGLLKLPNVISFSVLELISEISAAVAVENVAAELGGMEDDPKLKMGAAAAAGNVGGAVELDGPLSRVAVMVLVPADVMAKALVKEDALVEPLLEICFVKLLEVRVGVVEELKGLEARNPLFIFEILADAMEEKKPLVDVEVDAAAGEISEAPLTFSAFWVFLSSPVSDSKNFSRVSLAKLFELSRLGSGQEPGLTPGDSLLVDAEENVKDGTLSTFFELKPKEGEGFGSLGGTNVSTTEID